MRKKIFCIFKTELRFLSKTKTRRVYDIAKELDCLLLMPKKAYIEQKIRKNVKAIYRFPVLKENIFLVKILNLLFILYYAIRYIRKERPSIIYTPPTSVILIGYICKLLFNVKWLVDLYDPPISAIKRKNVEKFLFTMGSKILKILINKADFVAVSIIPEACSWLKVKNVLYLTNGVDLQNYGIYSIRCDINDYIKIVSIETSIKNSGLDYLIKAFRTILDKSNKKLKLLLIGYLDGTEEIRNIIKNYGLEDYVEYKGGVPSENLPEILKDCDIGVVHLPSGPHRDETYPLKVFEYMASGLAIVSFKLTGVSKILNEETAILVEPDSWEALAEGLLRLINNDSLRKKLAKKAFEQARMYDWKVINERFITKLREI